METTYACPVCGLPLERIDNTYACPNRHSFDVAREGYVNLILANQKHSKDPGDSQFMIEHRSAFLGQGYYDPLSQALDAWILQEIKAFRPRKKPFNILDLGCGEGFYSVQLLKFLDQAGFLDRVHVWGIDISKPAIQKAARKDSRIPYCVGNNYHLPYQDQSFDLIFSVFSPVDPIEAKRVLRDNGRLLCVRPGPDHLNSLASLIYGRFDPQGNPQELSEQFGLTEIETKRLTFPLRLKHGQDLLNLVSMTPYYWRLKPALEKTLGQTNDFSTTADFKLSLLAKPQTKS
jgi:23S rRNA (guanine745-N1)-methyltransferase